MSAHIKKRKKNPQGLWRSCAAAQESKLLYSFSNYINVMCCVSRVFTKKAPPLLCSPPPSLTSIPTGWIITPQAGCGSVQASFRPACRLERCAASGTACGGISSSFSVFSFSHPPPLSSSRQTFRELLAFVRSEVSGKHLIRFFSNQSQMRHAAWEWARLSASVWVLSAHEN